MNYHIEIFPEHRQYLGFSWSFDGVTVRYLVYNVLPFGLALGPFIFCKVMRVIVRTLRSAGLPCVVYIEDGIVPCADKRSAVRASELTKFVLSRAVFRTNDKSTWEPTQKLVWLGIEID